MTKINYGCKEYNSIFIFGYILDNSSCTFCAFAIGKYELLRMSFSVFKPFGNNVFIVFLNTFRCLEINR